MIFQNIYEHAKEQSEDSNDEWDAMRAIANGTPLSKGHGRLIDKDALIGKIHVVKSIVAVLDAPIIIEADTEK